MTGKVAIRSFLIACALAGITSVAPVGVANAMPVGAAGVAKGEVSSAALLHEAQFRGRRRGAARGAVRPAFRGGARPVFRGGRTAGGRARVRRNNALGTAAAIGVGAALLGAIAGSAARPRPQVVEEEPVYVRRRPDYSEEVEYCMRRFRSYNPDTGLYRGFDGLMHPCP
jgi:hypothetical protein